MQDFYFFPCHKNISMFQTFVAILHRKCDLRRKIMPENVIMLRFFFI